MKTNETKPTIQPVVSSICLLIRVKTEAINKQNLLSISVRKTDIQEQ
jgi:hypothetical protein